MNEDELVTILQDAGLSPYQAEAYVTLLELGSAPATDVAEASDVPDPRIYDVLRDLEGKGFVETYEQDSLHARAHNPDDVLSDLRSQAEQYEAAAEEIEERWNEPAIAQSKVSVVSRFDTVIGQAREYIREAENQIQLAATPEQFDALRDELAAAVDDDVFVKFSLHADDLDDVDIDVRGACTEARFRPLPTPFVAIVDRELAVFSPHSDSTNQYGILVDDRSHTYVFHWFFLTSLWDVWDVFHSERTDELPATYVDVRYCIRDIAPLLEESATVEASIVGTDTATGRRREVEGTVVDVRTTNDLLDFDGGPDSPGSMLSVGEFAGVAALVVDAGDECVEVGGWGATLEDVEAERITVTDVEQA